MRQIAAGHWTRVRPEDLPTLAGWDAREGERHPALSVEQRGQVATRLAHGRANQSALEGTLALEEAQFREMLAAASAHPGSRNVRQSFVNAALTVAPEIAVGPLRERYPNEPEVAAALRQLEALGQPFDLRFTAFDGRAVDLREYRGKVVFINFWAKRFAFSTSLLPKLKELVAQHGEENLALISINTDDNAAAVRDIIEQHAITWPVHHDGQGHQNAIATRHAATMLPYYLLIDRTGRLRHRGIQPLAPTAQGQLASLLAEKPLPSQD